MKKNWENRAQAGLRLAELLKRYDNSLNTVVVGLARGGVEVAYAISSKLNLPLDVICPKKISHPFDPEYAIGAITEYGDCKINYLEAYRLGLKDLDIAKIKDQKLQEAIEKEKKFHFFRPNIEWKSKTILIVDDGIATGLTFEASLLSLKKLQVGKVIAVTPVASCSGLSLIKPLVDEIVCILEDPDMGCVGNYYEDFSEVTDQKVLEYLKNQKPAF